MRNTMKLKLVAIAVSAAFSLTAHAGHDNGNQNSQHPQNGGGAGGNGTAIAGAAAGAIAGAKSSANNSVRNSNTVKSANTNVNTTKVTGINGQQQQQGQSTDNANNSNQDVNIGGDTFEATKRSAATAYAPTIFPTAPCMGSTSGGLQTGIFGISAGGTWTSEECMILETARGFDQAGYKTDGLAIRCKAKHAMSAPSCVDLAKQAAAQVEAEAAAKSAKVTPTATTADAPESVTFALPEYVAPSAPVRTVSENGYYSVVTNPLGQ